MITMILLFHLTFNYKHMFSYYHFCLFNFALFNYFAILSKYFGGDVCVNVCDFCCVVKPDILLIRPAKNGNAGRSGSPLRGETIHCVILSLPGLKRASIDGFYNFIIFIHSIFQYFNSIHTLLLE